MAYTLIQSAFNTNTPANVHKLKTTIHVSDESELTDALAVYVTGAEDGRIDEAPIPHEIEPPGLVVKWKQILTKNGRDLSNQFPQYPWSA